MGNKSSLMLQDEEIKMISEETGFNPLQIEKLYARFAHLDRANCGALNKNDLLSIPELAINPLCDRLIQMFFGDCQSEDERINFRQFLKVLATFNSSSFPAIKIDSEPADHNQLNHDLKLQDNQATQIRTDVKIITSQDNNDGLSDSLRNKLLFVFRIYDADNDGRISFNDLRCILKMMVGNYIEDIQLDKIANRAFAEVDTNNDGYIEFNEFCRVFSGKDLDDKLRVKFF